MPGRSFIVRRCDAGRPLQEWLGRRLGLPRDKVLGLIRQRQVRIGGTPCTQPRRRLVMGQRVQVAAPAVKTASRPRAPSPRPHDSTPDVVVRYADEHIVVVDKPAGLTTMRHPEEAAEFGARGRRFLPPTLADLLPPLLAATPGGGRPVIPVHRLDKDTSGLVVFARTPQAARHLGQQFRAHTVDRLYLALTRGPARAGRIESWLLRDRGDGRRGSSPVAGQGQQALTHVRVVEELGDYTLIECRLETGRTHQVRIHLGEAGTPLCGDRLYDRPLHGRPLPDGSGARRVALHAAVLGLVHPATGKSMRWTSPLPRDMASLLQRLRKPGP